MFFGQVGFRRQRRQEAVTVRERLRSAGLLGRTVVALHPCKTGPLQIVVARDASPDEIARLDEVVGAVPHQVISRSFGAEPVSDARGLLRAAGLISTPVIGLELDNRDIVIVTVLQAASSEDVARVQEALGEIKFRIQKRPMDYNAIYEPRLEER